jgi:hypothetical protein
MAATLFALVEPVRRGTAVAAGLSGLGQQGAQVGEGGGAQASRIE